MYIKLSVKCYKFFNRISQPITDNLGILIPASGRIQVLFELPCCFGQPFPSDPGQFRPSRRPKRESFMSIPKNMQETYDAIAALINDFCDRRANDEYRMVCLRLCEKLCRKRPSPLLRGYTETWAAGIVYAIGSVNFIFDKSQAVHMTGPELAAEFGVAASTASGKGKQIRNMFGMGYYSPEWTLPSKFKNNPLMLFGSLLRLRF
jgi:hypothetical protein